MWLDKEELTILNASLWNAEEYISRVFDYRLREDGISVKIELHKPSSSRFTRPSTRTLDVHLESFSALVRYLTESAHRCISVELSFNMRLWLELASLSSATPTVSKELQQGASEKLLA